MSQAAVNQTFVNKVRLRQVALPAEHGGWGFLLEPLIAGLAVAISPTGILIAAMTIGAFLARQPLKVLIADRFGMRNRPRAVAAFLFLALFGLIFAAGLAGAIVSAGRSQTTQGMPFLLPFVLVLPLVLVQGYFDLFRRGRALIAELAGAISITASVAAIALAAGMSPAAAAGLWLIFIARLIPSVLYVRERLRLEKGKTFSRGVVIGSHTAALAVVATLAGARLVPYLPVIAISILLVRSIRGLSPGRQKLRAMQIGVLEIVYGALTVLSVVIGYRFAV